MMKGDYPAKYVWIRDATPQEQKGQQCVHTTHVLHLPIIKSAFPFTKRGSLYAKRAPLFPCSVFEAVCHIGLGFREL